MPRGVKRRNHDNFRPHPFTRPTVEVNHTNRAVNHTNLPVNHTTHSHDLNRPNFTSQFSTGLIQPTYAPFANMVLPTHAFQPTQAALTPQTPPQTSRTPKSSQLYLTNLPTQTNTSELTQMFQVLTVPKW